MFPLLANGTADDYIAQENIKLLSAFTVAGGWIIAALILAPVFWKAGEERWKAYIPVYKWAVVFRLAAWPTVLTLLGLLPLALGLLAALFANRSPSVLLWFNLFSSIAGPAPSAMNLVQVITSQMAVEALILGVAAALSGVVFQLVYGAAVYRMGAHLSRTGVGWLVLSMLLPVVPLIIFAADKSIWLEDYELDAKSAKISVEVPFTPHQSPRGSDLS